MIGTSPDKKSENFGAASCKSSEDFFQVILIATLFKKSENLVKIPRKFLENFVDRSKTYIYHAISEKLLKNKAKVQQS